MIDNQFIKQSIKDSFFNIIYDTVLNHLENIQLHYNQEFQADDIILDNIDLGDLIEVKIENIIQDVEILGTIGALANIEAINYCDDDVISNYIYYKLYIDFVFYIKQNNSENFKVLRIYNLD